MTLARCASEEQLCGSEGERSDRRTSVCSFDVSQDLGLSFEEV